MAENAERPKSTKTSVTSAPERSGPSTALLAGGGVLGVAVLAGVVYLAVGAFSGEKAGIDFSYLPEETELVVRVRVADALSTPVLQEHLDEPGRERLQAMIGGPFGGNVALADVDEVVIGVRGTASLGRLEEGSRAGRVREALQKLDGVAVVRTRRELPDLSGKRIDYGGDYYVVSPSAVGATAAWKADPRTLVVGSEQGVQAAMDRGRGNAHREAFDFVDADRHVVVAVASSDGEAVANANGPLVALGGKSLEKVAEAVRSGIRGFALGLDFGNDVDLLVQYDAVNSSKARELKDALQEARTSLKQKYGSSRGGDAVNAELAKHLQEFVTELEVHQDGDVVAVTSRIPGDIGGQAGVVRLAGTTDGTGPAAGNGAGAQGASDSDDADPASPGTGQGQFVGPGGEVVQNPFARPSDKPDRKDDGAEPETGKQDDGEQNPADEPGDGTDSPKTVLGPDGEPLLPTIPQRPKGSSPAGNENGNSEGGSAAGREPDEVVASAKAAWVRARGARNPPLLVRVVLTGGDVADAEQWGMLKVSEAKDDRKNDLQLYRREARKDPTKRFFPVSAGGRDPFTGKSSTRISVPIVFRNPAGRDPSLLKKLAGSVKLRVRRAKGQPLEEVDVPFEFVDLTITE